MMTPSEALPRAKAAATKALELDDRLGEAHTSLAFCLDGFDWDFAAAEREFRRGVELGPSYATAHHWYAWHLALLRRDRDALDEMKKAESLDPLSLIIKADLAELLVITHFPDESVQQSRRTIEMDPGFALAHNQLGQAYLQKGCWMRRSPNCKWRPVLPAAAQHVSRNLARTYAAAGKE